MAVLRSTQEKLVILASAVRSFFDPMAGAEDTVKWFQHDSPRRGGGMTSTADRCPAGQPLRSPSHSHLEQRLFKKLDSVVMASATLGWSGAASDYFNGRAGLAGELAPRRRELLTRFSLRLGDSRLLRIPR